MARAALVDLGFAGARLPPGTHICQIYSDEEERSASIERFLMRGLEGGERSACFSDKTDAEAVDRWLRSRGTSLRAEAARNAVVLDGARDVYLEGDRFEPERLLGLLRRFHEDSVAAGYSAGRVIGEMCPEVQHLDDGARLLEYEARVSVLLRESPVTAVCQYDAAAFGGATIMDVLRVHPMMVVRGAVMHNPFYTPPEQVLA